MFEILVGVLITFYYFLSFCFGMDASVKCYIHTRTFLHKSNQKNTKSKKFTTTFKKVIVNSLIDKRLNFEVNPI